MTKGVETFFLPPLVDDSFWRHSGESQWPCCEDMRAAPWRRPWGEKLRPPADSHSPSPTYPSDDLILCQQFDWNLMATPEPEPPNQAASKFLTHRNCEKNQCLLFKPLRLGQICHTSIDNSYILFSRDSAYEFC